MDVAARENASSAKSIHELQDVIQRITLTEKIEESKEFANRIQTSVHGFSSTLQPGHQEPWCEKGALHRTGGRFDALGFGRGWIPQHNRREETLLKRTEHRKRLAEAIYRGLSRYASSLSHFQVATAKP